MAKLAQEDGMAFDDDDADEEQQVEKLEDEVIEEKAQADKFLLSLPQKLAENVAALVMDSPRPMQEPTEVKQEVAAEVDL